MSQTSIATKTALSVLTGTAGTTYNVNGRDTNQIVSWRGVLDATVPASDKVLSQSGSFTTTANQVNGWKSKTTLSVPVMETISTGSAVGYQAQPKIASTMNVTVSIFRPSNMTQAQARTVLEELGYMLVAGAVGADALKFLTSMIGYTPADA